jgi:hypothetical protein
LSGSQIKATGFAGGYLLASTPSSAYTAPLMGADSGPISPSPQNQALFKFAWPIE